MSLTINDGAVFLISAVTLLAALGVVFKRNIVHSALFLVLTFLGVAGVFFTLGAGFLGLVQILVYGGAISVLIIFSIMLVMKGRPERTNPFNPGLGTHLWGIFMAILLTLALSASAWFSKITPAVGELNGDAIGDLAHLMLGKYVVAFEAAAVLLLVAVVGAIILAKGAEEP